MSSQIISGALKEKKLEKDRSKDKEKEKEKEKDKDKDADIYSADKDLGSIFSVPLGRVYETRGTLLLETQGMESVVITVLVLCQCAVLCYVK